MHKCPDCPKKYSVMEQATAHMVDEHMWSYDTAHQWLVWRAKAKSELTTINGGSDE